MIASMKRLFGFKTKPKDQFKINIVNTPPTNSLTFTLALGFDVGVGVDSLDIHVASLAFMSGGPKSTKFIEDSSEEIVKAAVAALCFAAGQHIVTPGVADFRRSRVDVPKSESPTLLPPTKTDINLN